MPDNDANEVTPQPQEVTIVNEFIALLKHVADANDTIQIALSQPDGTERSWSLTVGQTGTRERIVKVEETGELDVVGHGKDAAGNIDPIRTNADMQLQVEIVPGSSKLLGQSGNFAGEVALYTVPASKKAVIDKVVFLLRDTNLSRTLWWGHSPGGGALANQDYLGFGLIFRPSGHRTFEGPIYMAATDELRFQASAAQFTVLIYGREWDV